jgi:hypothetical protein
MAFNQQQLAPTMMQYYGGNSYGSLNVGGHTNAPNNMSNLPDKSLSLVMDSNLIVDK